MRYYRADLQQVNRSEWRGYVEDLHLFFQGTTRPQAESNCREAIEQQTGVVDFSVIFLLC